MREGSKADMAIQIIVVTLEDGRVDCKVQGSPLSVSQYGDAVALVIRSIAGLFASNAPVTEADVVEEILKVVDDSARIPATTQGTTLQ